jgi:hypothetical protein
MTSRSLAAKGVRVARMPETGVVAVEDDGVAAEDRGVGRLHRVFSQHGRLLATLLRPRNTVIVKLPRTTTPICRVCDGLRATRCEPAGYRVSTPTTVLSGAAHPS